MVWRPQLNREQQHRDGDDNRSGEQMVRPNDQAEHTDTRHGVDHPDRAKHGLTRKGGDHVADLKSGWQASAPHQPKGSFVHSHGIRGWPTPT